VKDIERIVIDAFREVLRDSAEPGESVDSGSDFFELGGNSLLGVRLVARLRQEAGVKVGIRDLFQARTAGALAEVVGRRAGGS
jgi:acyl carrier protein